MLILALILIFVSITLLTVGVKFGELEKRASLKVYDLMGISEPLLKTSKENKFSPGYLVRMIASVNRPLVTAQVRQQLFRNIGATYLGISPEEFYLLKEVCVVVFLITFPRLAGPDLFMFAVLMALAAGWVLPDFWLRSKIGKIKEDIVKQLPDTVDLLGLCVNAGLDFMMALKWVIEKSTPSLLIAELNNVLQEINVGKPRRDALRDLAKKYELPDLSTFSRTLIQADKMGTSVSEALNILSEDMRLARFRRGEAMALKSPLKMLFPLLFCIFPVVGILVGAPIFLDFMYNNPLKGMTGG